MLTRLTLTQNSPAKPLRPGETHTACCSLPLLTAVVEDGRSCLAAAQVCSLAHVPLSVWPSLIHIVAFFALLFSRLLLMVQKDI
jgi:hypothetical protein